MVAVRQRNIGYAKAPSTEAGPRKSGGSERLDCGPSANVFAIWMQGGQSRV